jgi:hypothetical protein
MDLGLLGGYGRWGEVNWVWSEWLTTYHAIFSIAIPITLVELTFPNQRNTLWLSHRQFGGIAVLLSAVTAFGALFLTTYRPPFIHYLLSMLLVGILLFLAWKIKYHRETRESTAMEPLKTRSLRILHYIHPLSPFRSRPPPD